MTDTFLYVRVESKFQLNAILSLCTNNNFSKYSIIIVAVGPGFLERRRLGPSVAGAATCIQT